MKKYFVQSATVVPIVLMMLSQIMAEPLKIGTHDKTIYDLNFSTNDSLLVSVSGSGNARLWQIDEQNLPWKEFSSPKYDIRCACFSSDDQMIAFGCDWSYIYIYYRNEFGHFEENPLELYHPSMSHGPSLKLSKVSDIRSITFSPDNKLLVGSDIGQIYLWKNNFSELETKKGKKIIRNPCFSPDGNLLATNNEKGIVIFQRDKETELFNIFQTLQHNHINSLDFSTDGTLLISGSHETNIKIWERANVESPFVFKQELKKHTQSVRSVCFSPCGNYMVSGGRDCYVRLWQRNWAGYFHQITKFGNNEQWVEVVKFNHTGSKIAVGYDDGDIMIYDFNELLEQADSDNI